jgi:hypothetical protein
MIRTALLGILLGLPIAMGVGDCAGADTIQNAAALSLDELNTRSDRLQVKAVQSINAFNAVTGKRLMCTVIDPSSKRPETDLLIAYRKLYFAAGFTRGVSEIVCADSATRHLCKPKFDPKWLVYPKDADPTPELLAEWVLETETALEPLWSGLCELAVSNTSNPKYCDLG